MTFYVAGHIEGLNSDELSYAEVIAFRIVGAGEMGEQALDVDGRIGAHRLRNREHIPLPAPVARQAAVDLEVHRRPPIRPAGRGATAAR